MSTVAGRVGLVNDRWLVFAKLGGGWVQSDETDGECPWLAEAWNGRSTNGGWLIGGGIKYRLQIALDRQNRRQPPDRTVKLEFGHGPGGGIEPRLQTIKAGINYKFESGLTCRG